MPRVNFAKNMSIKYRGRFCTVMEELPDDKVKIKDSITDQNIIEPLDTLVQAFFKGDLEFISPEGKQDKYKRADHTLSDEELKKEAKRKEEYVKECMVRLPNRCSGKALEPIIAEVAARRGEAPPSANSVYRWRKKYVAGGMDIRALYELHVNKGNRTPRLDPEVYGIVDRVVHTDYLNTEKITIAEACERIEESIDQDNSFRPPGSPKLHYPDRSTIYRIIEKIDDYEEAVARYGKPYAHKMFDPIMQGPRPERPLERLEIDNTPLPLFVVDNESRMPLGLANLTSAIDVRTKCTWGFYLGFEPFSSLSLMNCLKHGIRDKSYVKQLYPSVQNNYDPYGLPENLFCDNGMDFLGKHCHDACDQLGINLEYAPVKMPWYKASIENYFGKIANSLLRNLPGKLS